MKSFLFICLEMGLSGYIAENCKNRCHGASAGGGGEGVWKYLISYIVRHGDGSTASSRKVYETSLRRVNVPTVITAVLHRHKPLTRYTD